MQDQQLRVSLDADNRNKCFKTWVVAGHQAADRELGRSRKRYRSIVCAGDATGTRRANCASGGRPESARRPLHRPGPGPSNGAGSCRAAAHR